MQGTLMGADKEWIYSFSTWDYLLPGGTQLASEWHARLCQQSAESAPLHRKAKSLPSPWWVPHPGCQHQAAQGTEHKPTASLQGKGPDTLLALPPLPILVFNFDVRRACFYQMQNACTAVFFSSGKKTKTIHVQPSLLWETRYFKPASTAKPFRRVPAAAPKLSLPP